MTTWLVLIDLKRLNYLPPQDDSECETIGDYHDEYLKLDVLLLADIFEKFCKTCMEFYSLDPLHYYTTPGLAWDAALRMSRVDLQLITDENMYNFVENSSWWYLYDLYSLCAG